MTYKLSLKNLENIGSRLKVPTYQRSDLLAGILHFGVGNFHRAHQGVYLDDLFNLGVGLDYAIVGTGVMASDAQMMAMLREQDYLTTIVEQEAEKSQAHITGPMIDFIDPGNVPAILERLEDPAIRIISLTVTEGGYYIDPATDDFNPQDPAIRHDGENPDTPKTAFGMIVAGLKKRRAAGIAAFTIMSCDNLPHNGKIAKNAVTGLAALSDPELAEWINAHVAFPNGMVDRITPATGDRERSIAAEQFGVEDKSPVFCEGYNQWVLEDNFPSGRPELERVGVQFVSDVTPYENMKIRILNGGHATIAYPAGLMDIHFAHEALENTLVRNFLQKVECDEIIPVVPPVPDTNLDDYFSLIKRRFANPKIADTIQRLCLDGSNRQPKFIIPSIMDNLQAGRATNGLALVSALWCRYCFGETDSGAIIEPNDPNWDRLQAQAKLAKDNPLVWLAMHDIYGELDQSGPFRDLFAGWLTMLWREGTKETLSNYLEYADQSV
jgi:mannitol 2-dehydrogenase